MVDSGPSFSEFGLTKIESYQFKRRSVYPKDELARIRYFQSHQELREAIVTNPFSEGTEEQIKKKFGDENRWSIMRTAIIAEPKGEYEREFNALPRNEQSKKLINQIDSSAEMTVRIQKYIESNLSDLDQVSDEELYKILCRTAFGTENEQEIRAQYALSQRRGFRMSIVNFLETRNKLLAYRVEASADPKAFTEKYLKNQFTGNITIEQLPIGFIIYLDEQDYALIKSDDKSPKSITSNGLILADDWLPQELKSKIILLNKGGKEFGIKTPEELARTRGHEIRHVIYGEFHTQQPKTYSSEFWEALPECKTEQDYRMLSGMTYEEIVEEAKDEIIAYFSYGKFDESHEALRFHLYQVYIEAVEYVLMQRRDLSGETKKAIIESFTNNRRRCFEAIKRMRLVAERMYKKDDSPHNDFAEALLSNTPGTKIHRLAKYTDLTAEEIRDGSIIRKQDEQAIEELSNVLNIPEQYDELGKTALPTWGKSTVKLPSDSFPVILKGVLEDLSGEQYDDWGEKAVQALKHMEKQLPTESLPVLLDAVTEWSDKRWTFYWVEQAILITEGFITIYGFGESDKKKIMQAMKKVLEKKGDNNFEQAAKFAQQVVDKIH